VAALAANLPTGMDAFINGVETGKKFHPFWPPASGSQIVGTVVIASKPNKPEAFFQTINSPNYRNSAYTKDFIIGEFAYTAPELKQEKTIGVGVAFSTLDDISKSLTPAKAAAPGGTATVEPQPASLLATSTEATSSDAKKGDTSAKDSKDAGKKASAEEEKKVTGVDFSKFKTATVKATGLKAVFYDLPTLIDIEKNHALQPAAEQLLTPAGKGWIISRTLVVDSLEYTLTANTKIDAGLFAKLVAWMPTVSVKYKNDTTVVLKTSAPITIGYKLWRPGAGVQGQAIEKTRAEDLGLDSKAIDAILAGKQ